MSFMTKIELMTNVLNLYSNPLKLVNVVTRNLYEYKSTYMNWYFLIYLDKI